jgi:hypothetical protein
MEVHKLRWKDLQRKITGPTEEDEEGRDRAGRSGDRIPVVAKSSAHVQAGPGAHPASYTMVTVSFPGVKRSGCGANHLPHLAPRLRKEWSYMSSPFCSIMTFYRVKFLRRRMMDLAIPWPTLQQMLLRKSNQEQQYLWDM